MDATLGDPAGVPGRRAATAGSWRSTRSAATPRRSSTALRALGEVTGEMHTRARLGGTRPGVRARGAERRRRSSLLTATIDEEIERIFLDLPETRRSAPIRGRGQDVRERLQALSHVGAGGRVIRTHGDYHLGQTMLADRGWVILDFEGEPARPLPERRLKRSPLRDVAGMLRSFSYAAAGSRILRGAPRAARAGRTARATTFLDGYFETRRRRAAAAGPGGDAQAAAVFELEKAVYELRYELNNRPDWVAIPVAGIARLLESNGGS